MFCPHSLAGEALRAVSGLALGYVLRPFFRVEQLLWPVYNWGMKVVSPEAEYQVSPSTNEEMMTTLNRLGLLVAVAFLLPQVAMRCGHLS